MYQYVKDTYTQENSTGVIRRTADNASIPFAPDNTDYQAYLKWVDAGNVPAPADEGTQ